MLDNLEEYTDAHVYEAEYGQYKGDFDLSLHLMEKDQCWIWGVEQVA